MSSDEARTSGPTCAPGTLEEELQKIEREQEEAVDLEGKERELEELHQRARHLAGELRAARTTRRRRAAEQALPVVQPREPCSAAWADMTGDERVRACGRCKARVYDLGGLEASDARRLLSEHEGRLPTQVVGRVDGTVTVESCAEKRQRFSPVAIGVAASAAASLLMSGVALGYALSDRPTPVEPSQTMASADMEVLVDDLVKERTRDELAKALADAEANKVSKAPTPPAPPTPDAAQPQTEQKDRSERRRRRSRCGGSMRLYDPWASPFFLWEYDGGSGCD